jgi:putative MATE family efflux protein
LATGAQKEREYMAIIKSSDRLGKEKINTLLFKLSGPAIIGMVVHSLYNIIDSIYIGRVSTDALSALSISFPIQMFLISIGVGTGIGANSLISRLLGRGDKKRATIVAEHVFFLAIIYGLIFAVLGFLFIDTIMYLFTTDELLLHLSKKYMRIILTGSLAIFAPATFNYILRGEGNTFAPMITMIIGAVLNIILDPFLIYGLWIFPEMGIEGAAYATVFSRLISGIFITIILFSKKTEIKPVLSKFTFDFKIIKEIYQVGIPATVNRLIFSVSIVLINRILGTYNTIAIAVMGVIFRLQSFFLMSVFGLAQGYLPLLGYNFGHRRPDRMKKTIKSTTFIALLFGLSAFLAFLFIPDLLLRLFNKSEEFLKIGKTALPRISFAYIFMVLNILSATTFQALGKGFPSLVLTLLRQFILLIPGMFLLGHFFGLDALWFALPCSEILTMVIGIVWITGFLKGCLYNLKYTNIKTDKACR